MVATKEVLFSDLERTEYVERVERNGNIYTIDFSKAPTWDVLRKPMVTALHHFHICVGYECETYTSPYTTRFKIVRNEEASL